MRRSAVLYYNPDFGHIITSRALKRGTLLGYVTEPSITVDSQANAGLLGDAINKAMEITKNAQPLEPSEAKDYEFWQLTGIKRYNTFTKEFRCISIYENDDQLVITEQKREKSGHHVGRKGDPATHLPLPTTPTQIGAAVIKILSGDATTEDDTNRKFETHFGNTVSYIRPSDAFLDLGDGGTDAYQIFRHEEDEENGDLETFIGFMVSHNHYGQYSEREIKEKWQQWYGELEEFQYKEFSDAPLKIEVTGKTKTTYLASYLYQDGEELLEVQAAIDMSKLSERIYKEAMDELQKIIRSIKITPI